MIYIPKTILLTTLILLYPLNDPIQAINENVARSIAISGGILVGGASGIGVHLLSHYVTNENIAPKFEIAAPIIGITLGSLTGHFLHQWLYTKTPSARIAYAKDFAQKASDTMETAQKNFDEIITKNFTSDELFIAYITKQFATDWPLVSARNFLIDLPKNLKEQINSIIHQLNNAQSFLNLAMKEMQKNTNKYTALLQEGTLIQKKIKNIEVHCAQYDENITLIKPEIDNLINTIALYPQFTLQAILYENHIQHEAMLKKLNQQSQQQQSHQNYLLSYLLYRHLSKK